MNVRKLLGIGAIVAVAGVGGTAFTAGSTIDKPNVHQGSVAQSVAGITITNVSYNYLPASDTVTSITANAAEDLVADQSVLTVEVNGGSHDCAGAKVFADAPANTQFDHTAITCDLGAGVANVTNVRFIATR